MQRVDQAMATSQRLQNELFDAKKSLSDATGRREAWGDRGEPKKAAEWQRREIERQHVVDELQQKIEQAAVDIRDAEAALLEL